ncbi:MAG: rRNA maturation RNase YbeY [Candidatus Pacebacteria bacterium]|nr:rRNA maturation RNase YbeY [Candidatus Paceibacterota bacterium]MDR3583082.1 rRNA maturation RNase YbeY [Candidatus Paceibacterota bacterium]
MKLILELNDRVGSGIKRSFISKIIKETLARAGKESLEKKNITISMAVISEDEIRELNRTYRKKNKPTDVLSFAEHENRRELEEALAGIEDVFLGELVLCYNDMVKYCAQNKVAIQEETARVISHGTLHLLGFSHGKKMFEIQDEVAINNNIKI